jgi:hypothetical protein
VTGLKIEIDWDKDGFGAGDDVTGDVQVAGDTVTCSYGRDLTSALAPTVAGQGGFVLDNKLKRYTSRNTASPLYGKIKPARPVRITRSYPAVGTGDDAETDIDSDVESGPAVSYTLLVGHTDAQPLNPDVESKRVTLSLMDALADFKNTQISTPVYRGIRTGQAINYILDACGWTGGRDIDTGATQIEWFWEDGIDALEAMEKIVRSEGPPALLTMGVNNEIIFWDRHHRILSPASITEQSTWRNWAPTAPEPTMNEPFSVDEAWANIINTGQVSVDVRAIQIPEDVWTQEGLITLQASETKRIIASASEPFINARSPVAGTDYTLVQGSVTITLSRTSGASTEITITAGGSAAVVQDLKLSAQPIRTAYTIQVSASDPTSIADYGQAAFAGDLPWCNQYDAKAILDIAIGMHKQPLPTIEARFLIKEDRGRGEMALSRNLSDLVWVIEAESMLNQGFYVEWIGHAFTEVFDHEVSFRCEAVPASRPDPATILILDSTVPGHRLGEGVLVL